MDTISTLVQDWVLSSIARRCTKILSLSQGVRVQRPAIFDRTLAGARYLLPRQQF